MHRDIIKQLNRKLPGYQRVLLRLHSDAESTEEQNGVQPELEDEVRVVSGDDRLQALTTVH